LNGKPKPEILPIVLFWLVVLFGIITVGYAIFTMSGFVQAVHVILGVLLFVIGLTGVAYEYVRA
jgi:hypothetical protein